MLPPSSPTARTWRQKSLYLFQKRMKIAQEHYTARVEQAYKDHAAAVAAKPEQADGPVDGLVPLRRRLHAAIDPVLGHAAPARQQLRRAHARAACRRCSLSSTTRSPTAAALRAAGQLRAGRDHAAGRRDGRSRSGGPTSSSIRARVTGPGIGGFKDDSQVGVALAAGHPVYFVIFFRDPEPGQTLLDVCDRRAAVRAHRARAASRQPEAGDRRQLPGRAGRR